VNKIEDQYLHIFSPTGMWGDQILNLFSCYYHMVNTGKEGIIIHTAKDLFDTHHKRYVSTDKNILKFWSTFNFVKGIIFDVDQRTLPTDAQNSNYNLFPHLNLPYDDNFQYDLSNEINFSLFPKRFTYDIDQKSKIAVFQPVSLKNKPVELKKDFIATWDKSVSSLLEKKYKIYAVGSSEDLDLVHEIYGHKSFLYLDNVINLMGCLDIFESIELVMKKADFVLSCDSWAGWYGIASRKKTAYAAGPLIENGTDSHYLNCIKNKDVFFMDYSSKKEETDKNMAKWIQNNA
tara:strand:+ start:126 stop:995 length:870 start_codon:yes stop_codon:yes gene_type:complete